MSIHILLKGWASFYDDDDTVINMFMMMTILMTTMIIDDHNLAYLIVSKESGLSRDGASKRSAPRGCSHTCKEIS